MLSPYELELARQTVIDTMTETCTVKVASPSQDAAGFPTTTYSDVTNVACRVGKWAVDGREYFAERIHAKGGVKFTLSRFVSLQDKIVFDGDTYEILQGDTENTTDAVCWVYYGVRL